jgi:A/G-specific adenine glycosylase
MAKRTGGPVGHRRGVSPLPASGGPIVGSPQLGSQSGETKFDAQLVRNIRPPELAKKRRRLLRSWFEHNGRIYPWRLGQSSWEMMLAEMLLRRTRADQVAAHFPRLLEQYPTPRAMAEASVDEVVVSLKPLGLVWRARNLHRCAAIISSEHDGAVPADRNALLELPGVGPYVADSIRAAGGAARVLLTDTNTVRVAARCQGIRLVGDIRRRADVQSAISELLAGPASARDWWGVLDLAATICVPRTPRCAECPIQLFCVTGRMSTAGSENPASLHKC